VHAAATWSWAQTLSVGLTDMQMPFTMALEQMLAKFQ
jgi:hypothetical protein